MAESIAHIRRFQSSDDKLVRFTIGKASMESLAVANHRACVHPLTISLWLVLSYALVSFMGVWPTTQFGLLGYLQPIPIVAASFVPIMFLIDWLNRPGFERLTQTALRGPDMYNLTDYYSRSPASGFWILTNGDNFVGLIALDASDDSASQKSEGRKGRKRKESKTTPTSTTTATIRHFYVDEAYRKSGVQEDLLTHAIKFAFRSDDTIQRIRASDSPLLPYIRLCLRDAGFILVDHTEKVGAFGWRFGLRMLEKEDWLKKLKTD